MAQDIDIEVPAQDSPHKPVNLNGAYRFKVDPKGRVSLPAKFRRVLSTDLVVVAEPMGECLLVFENDGFEAWIDQLFQKRFGEYDQSSRKQSHLMTGLKSLSNNVEVDKSGRIMLPGDAREAVGIDKDVVIVGGKGRFEIWDAQSYDAMFGELDLTVFFGE